MAKATKKTQVGWRDVAVAPPADPAGPTMAEAAQILARTDMSAMMALLLPVCGLVALHTRTLSSPIEVRVGTVSVVIVEGDVEGVRFGESTEVHPLNPDELMEAGAFLCGLGAIQKLKVQQMSGEPAGPRTTNTESY